MKKGSVYTILFWIIIGLIICIIGLYVVIKIFEFEFAPPDATIFYTSFYIVAGILGFVGIFYLLQIKNCSKQPRDWFCNFQHKIN